MTRMVSADLRHASSSSANLDDRAVDDRQGSANARLWHAHIPTIRQWM